ncbi:MAG: pyridoxamine 5'-phosphate oxidase family protein [Planctomycetaceae bacterium]|nr:pyridoxamine 5'-phosphate oxidase family protein [Planctomycetaceae bacterium]
MAEIDLFPQVNLAFQSSSQYLSLSGNAVIVRDQHRVQQLWQEPWRVWFPGGPEDPEIVMVQIVPSDGEYWDHSGVRGVA